MATRLYLTNAAAPVTPAAATYTAAGTQTWELPTTPPAALLLARASNWPGATAFSTGSIAETSATANIDVCARRFVSDPLVGAQTISGTLIGQMMMRETNAAANSHAQVMVKVVSGNGTTLRGILYGGDLRTGTVDELTTALRNQKSPAPGVSPVTLSTVNALDGDRIVIEIGGRHNNTVTTSYATELRYGSLATPESGQYAVGGAETTDLNAWVEFSADLNYVSVSSIAHARTGNDSAGVLESGQTRRTVKAARNEPLTLFDKSTIRYTVKFAGRDTAGAVEAGLTARTIKVNGGDQAVTVEAGLTFTINRRSLSDMAALTESGIKSGRYHRTGNEVSVPVDAGSPASRTTITRSGAETALMSEGRRWRLLKKSGETVPVADTGGQRNVIRRISGDAADVAEGSASRYDRRVTRTETALVTESGQRHTGRVGVDSLPVFSAGTGKASVKRVGTDAIFVKEAGGYAASASVSRVGNDALAISGSGDGLAFISQAGNDSLSPQEDKATRLVAEQGEAILVSGADSRKSTLRRTGDDAASLLDEAVTARSFTLLRGDFLNVLEDGEDRKGRFLDGYDAAGVLDHGSYAIRSSHVRSSGDFITIVDAAEAAKNIRLPGAMGYSYSIQGTLLGAAG